MGILVEMGGVIVFFNRGNYCPARGIFKHYSNRNLSIKTIHLGISTKTTSILVCTSTSHFEFLGQQ